MIQVKIEFWSPKNVTVVTDTGFRYLDTNSAVSRTQEWNDTKLNIFKKFYSENNSLRYCNGSYLKFEDQELQNEYTTWYKSLDENTRFHMHYGNGVVD